MERALRPEHLSARERQIAEAYAGGQSYRQIAEQLFIAPTTVRTHLSTIYRKLGVSTKIELLRALERSDAAPEAGAITGRSSSDTAGEPTSPESEIAPLARKESADDLARAVPGIESLAPDPQAKASADEELSAAPPIDPLGERRHLTMSAVALAGSMELSTQLDPEQMQELLVNYQKTVAKQAARFQGHVANVMGDRMLVSFGWPNAHEDDAERAIRAALAIRASVGTLRSPPHSSLAVRIGIASGLVVVGEGVGHDAAIAGDAPNLAFRLQALANPGQIVIAESTRRLLGDIFELADLGTKSVEGIGEPVPVLAVTGEKPVESRFDARSGSALLPMVGREHELALLLERWSQAKAGEGQGVVLIGEAGIGKSRIARALLDAVAQEPHACMRYQCSPHHTNSALYPVIGLLERAAGFTRADTPEARLDKLEALLAQGTSRGGEAAPLVAALLSIPSAQRYPPLDLTLQRQKQWTFEVLLDQLEGLAAREPVLAIYEDLHWADPSTLELLGAAVDRVQGLRVLMVMTFRPGFAAPWTGHAHVAQLSLSRLTRRHGEAMVDHLTGGKPLPEPLVDQIVGKTDGVPLFVEELTKAVLETGLVTDAGDRYALRGPLPPLAVPATLRDSLMARLDRLAPVKEVAQVASVIGREFSHELLTAVADRREVEINDALDRLVASELIFRRGTPPAATYSFKHALVQETAYGSLLRGKRQLLHGRIAESLRQGSPHLAEFQPELLAHHFGEAGSPERAANCWLMAGRRAKARYANKEARAHLQKCLEAADTVPGDAEDLSATKIEAWMLLGDLAGLAEDLDQANACYRQALDLKSDQGASIAIRNKLHRPNLARRDGASIAFYEHGSGERTLLFVGPIVYGLAIFQPILERLCQEFRIVTVDCRGTGASDPLTRPFPLREHVEDVAAVIEALGCGAVTGVGISRGSNLLIILATLRPELISRLVLVGCPLASPSGDPSFSDEYRRQRAEAYERRDIEALLRIQSEFVYSEPGTDELKRWAVARRLKLPPDTILSFYDPDPGIDVTPLLERLAAPTLVTHGTDDRLISSATAEYVANELPNGQLYAFEGKGHLPIFTATEEFCDVLRQFVLAGSVPSSIAAAQGELR